MIEKHAPLKTASRKQKRIQQSPWLTKGLLTSIKNKQKLYKNYFLNGTVFEKSFYKKYANKLTRVKNLSKKLYYNATISEKKNNPKDLWKFINSVISPKRGDTYSPPKLLIDDAIVENPDEISEKFNEYFVNVGETIANSLGNVTKVDFKTFLKNSVPQTIVLTPPLPIEIYKIIQTLNIGKASGNDDIPSYFLRLGNEVLSPILSHYFAYCFNLGIFPQIFKTAKVVPIHKSGNKQLVNNYRPISLLSCLSKVLEKLIKTRLDKFFKKHNVIYDYQYGFRENFGVTHALLDVTTLSYDAIESKQYTALLLMDL